MNIEARCLNLKLIPLNNMMFFCTPKEIAKFFLDEVLMK